jgi:hypothetical protein
MGGAYQKWDRKEGENRSLAEWRIFLSQYKSGLIWFDSP